MTTSCDCQKVVGTSCLHCLVIERYHAQFKESVLNDKESSAVYVNHNGLLYLFSVATASDSIHHHSHKRTIVIFPDNEVINQASAYSSGYFYQCYLGIVVAYNLLRRISKHY